MARRLFAWKQSSMVKATTMSPVLLPWHMGRKPSTASGRTICRIRAAASSSGITCSAASAGKAAFTVTRKKAGSQDAFEKEITRILEDHQVDLIILAGFLAILSQDFTDRWAGRIINIHPSLIPSFCGTGYYGLKVHEAALERGVKISGATVHFVDSGTDTGPILLQKAVHHSIPVYSL